jgi:hypothetical protein
MPGFTVSLLYGTQRNNSDAFCNLPKSPFGQYGYKAAFCVKIGKIRLVGIDKRSLANGSLKFLR